MNTEKTHQGTVIGIDIGGSSTKIVGFYPGGELIEPLYVKANDPLTSAYGAFGRFTVENSLSLSDIDRVMMTGVGASFITSPIYSLPCKPVSEFRSVGLGGLYLSGLDEAIVVSMGTGTAMIHAKRLPDGSVSSDYLGGTGVGGGTIVGLSRKMLGIDRISHLEQLCAEGDIEKVDLKIKDISKLGSYDSINADLTASNFGRLSDLATPNDIALGIVNMVTETVAMLSVFAARGHNVKKIVLTGNLTRIAPVRKAIEKLGDSFGVDFIIPARSEFATVIGAALT